MNIDQWQEIFGTISRHKLRAFLTAFGVAWGIFILVLLLGSGNGLQNGVNYLLKNNAENSVWIYKGTTSLAWQGLKSGRKIAFYNSDYQLLQQTEGVEHLTGRINLGNNNTVKYQNKVMNYKATAVHPAHQFLKKTLITTGRYINQLDIEQHRKVVCIGQTVALDLFNVADNSILGKSLTVEGITYQVVGILMDEGDEDEALSIYFPITTIQKIYGLQKIDQLMFTTGTLSPKRVRSLVKEVRKKLATKYNFSTKDRQAIYISNDLEQFQQFQTLFGMIQYFVWLVGAGCLLAGAIGVSNIMLINIKDRTKEIGIRKALGATNKAIIKLILLESAFLTTLAGYLGLLGGIGLIYLTQKIFEIYHLQTDFFRNPEINLFTIVAAIILLVLFGLLAGLIPALKAIRVQPIEAIRQ